MACPVCKSLSPQRARVLAFVRDRVAARGKFPSTHDITAHMGWSGGGSAALDVLYALAEAGLVRRRGRHATGKKSIIWELAA